MEAGGPAARKGDSGAAPAPGGDAARSGAIIPQPGAPPQSSHQRIVCQDGVPVPSRLSCRSIVDPTGASDRSGSSAGYFIRPSANSRCLNSGSGTEAKLFQDSTQVFGCLDRLLEPLVLASCRMVDVVVRNRGLDLKASRASFAPPFQPLHDLIVHTFHIGSISIKNFSWK